MIKAVIFGGTTEGRKLCEVCDENSVPVRYCVATADGARPVEDLPIVHVHVGRLNSEEMAALLRRERPSLVIDATHPYALEAGRNIAAACQSADMPLLRVLREAAEEQGCIYFNCIDDLVAWMERVTGNIFVTTGSSHAEAFTKLPDFQSRVWLRILPNTESLRTCLDLGYRPERLVCMQGPFSEELNYAMFKAAYAETLVTKNSGAAGGFSEKVIAAQRLGMKIAVLKKPDEPGGIALSEACKRIAGLGIRD